MTTKLNVFEQHENIVLFNKLRDEGRIDELFEKFYELANANPADVLSAKSKAEGNKLKSLEAAIEYFAESEQYEKCARLKQILSAVAER